MQPEAGDIAWVELGPVKGSEQDGRRPALVLTGAAYHEVSRRAVICPISSTERRWPFHVPLPAGLATEGVVLVDQVRMIDRSERIFEIIEHAPDQLLRDVRMRLAALVGIDAVSPAADSEDQGAT
jgi:mRNA interferase MazF